MSKKVLVIGAGGVIGQHMMISVPEGVEATFTRKGSNSTPLYRHLDLTRDYWESAFGIPDVVVNLAGESNVDAVEKNTDSYFINVGAVYSLSDWCDEKGVHLIHVSSQAALDPVNEYGKQKLKADAFVQKGKNWTIVRPTFVLGIRPFPGVGRENPAERILGGREEASVYDRFFSVSFAWDVAEAIWKIAQNPPMREIFHVGIPVKMTRLSVAHALGVYPKRITHDSLGIAPRPLDTTYQDCWSATESATELWGGMNRLKMEFGQRELGTVHHRAKEIAAFLHKPWEKCLEKLNTEFWALHDEVAKDFRLAAPKSESDLLAWYRGTLAYIWELTAYHIDPRLNYMGMCKGIVEALKSKGVETVLCLGDGVGDLSLYAAGNGLKPWYHDLFMSATALFAESRFHMKYGAYWREKIQLLETNSFVPVPLPADTLGTFDAVVSLDFLEHVPNVDEWVRAVYANLKPGGWFIAQNAFNIGSGDSGSIPMHLTINDHYERDWDPLLDSIGFTHEAGGWYRKPEWKPE